MSRALNPTALVLGVGLCLPFAAQGDPTSTTTTTIPGPRVAICHRSEDEGTVKTKTIRVARPALRAHLEHGDALGACPP
jgi:hypothetical protein